MARVSKRNEYVGFEVIYGICDEFGFRKTDIARILCLSSSYIYQCEKEGIILLRHIVSLKSAMTAKFAKDYADKLARLERAFTIQE